MYNINSYWPHKPTGQIRSVLNIPKLLISVYRATGHSLQMAMKVMQRNTCPVRRGREGWDCSAWKRGTSGGILSKSIDTWRENAKTTEWGCYQWCSVPGEEPLGTSRAQEAHSEHQKCCFAVWVMELTSSSTCQHQLLCSSVIFWYLP